MVETAAGVSEEQDYLNEHGHYIKPSHLPLYRQQVESNLSWYLAHRGSQYDGLNILQGAFNLWRINTQAVFGSIPDTDKLLYSECQSIFTPVQLTAHQEIPDRHTRAAATKKAKSSTGEVKALKTANKALTAPYPYQDLLGWHLVDYQGLYERVLSADTQAVLEKIGSDITNIVDPSHPDYGVLVEAGGERYGQLERAANV